MTATEYELIIFDCDGTLVDTELLCMEVVAAMLAKTVDAKFSLNYAMEHFLGMSMEGVIEAVSNDTGFVPAPDFMRDYEDRVNTLIAEKLAPPAPGVIDTLELLAGRVGLCVASNGEDSNVRNCIAHSGLSRFFANDRIFTKNMVKDGKPAPDLFLHAAATMNVSPERALVVEDSVIGVQAALAAGMKAVGLTTYVHGDGAAWGDALRRAGADHVTGDFADIAVFSGVTP